MRLKTASTHKESTCWEMQRREEQIQSLLKNLKTHVNPFHGAAKNMVTVVEVPVSIANVLLSSREKDKGCLKEFIEKKLTSCEQGFYEPNKRRCIQITVEKNKKPKEISILKEDW